MSFPLENIVNTNQPVYIESALGNAFLHVVGGQNLKWIIHSTDDGFYISSAVDPKFVIHLHGASHDNGAKASLWDKTSVSHGPQSHHLKVNFLRTPEGFHMIKFVHSGKFLQVHGASNANGTPITQWDYVDQSNLKWKIYPA